jgi:hypothetical protein
VFTFGLTEGWVHRESGTAYPTAPGTIAGSFDADVYAFKNFTSAEILEDFIKFRALVKEHNPNLRFILTVSPVPLTATASDDHVLVATTYSKSVLRAVAGELYSQFSDVDYFPSYEMIASPFSRAAFYEANLRSVSEEGVEAVMRVFFQEHGEGDQSVEQPAVGAAGTIARATDEAGATAMTSRESRREIREMRRQKQARRLRRQQANGGASNVVCEEILTDAFSR